ncbi:MAG TPA: hypothetical protein VNF73_09135, partial [Candidatus Saccharimonadales bacterium]|nr:hypothetical protein [Candidatus Saccharimonadales bacterium]
RLGFGPLALPIPANAPRAPAAASPAAEGWLRLGSGFGIPAIWIILSIAILPIVVYVISYLPWVALGNRLTDTWPPGNHGQTLLQLTKEMYAYHNDLRAAHPASSPWWAWLFNLKPVWFYQQSFDGNTSGSIYDAGNLVVWWIGVPAMAFCSWQAFKRRSLGLALIVLGYVWQWLPWVRIDRATFEYHYYTALPFLIIALGYFVAELWHGPSKKTWLLARVSAALAVMGPVLLWVAKGPLCTFVRVEAVNPGSQACVGNPGDLVVTEKVAGVVLVMILAIGVLIWQLFRLQRPMGPGLDGHPRGGGVGGGGVGGGGVGGRAGAFAEAALGGLAGLAVTAGLAIMGVAAANAILGSVVVLDVQGFQSSYLAVLLGIPLLLVAAFVLTARDVRRFVAGIVFAAVMEFLVFYPNISALPLPSAIVNAYQGVLPTYLYPFQFPVNTDAPTPVPKFLAPEPVALLLAITLTCLVVGYAAWVWRVGPPREPARPADRLTLHGDRA